MSDEKIQCRSADEIQSAHDILAAAVIGELPVPIGKELRELISASVKSLCWVLKHDHDTTFNELLNDIEKWGSEHGFKLCQHPEPQVERDTEVYAKSQFDLELWRREGLKRDNFTNLLFHMIAKSDLANKARLRTVFPVECQVFDDWFKEGK